MTFSLSYSLISLSWSLTVPHRFKVEDAKYAKDSACAWACIRLDRLLQGYRFVHLLDMKGAPTQGLLFVKIEKVTRPVENVRIVPVPVVVK